MDGLRRRFNGSLFQILSAVTDRQRPPWSSGQITRHYPTVIYFTEVHLSFCEKNASWILSCFHTLPNSDMEGLQLGSLICVHDHAYACGYTWGLCTPTASQHNIFHSEKLTHCSCAPDGLKLCSLMSENLVFYAVPIVPPVSPLGHVSCPVNYGGLFTSGRNNTYSYHK